MSVSLRSTVRVENTSPTPGMSMMPATPPFETRVVLLDQAGEEVRLAVAQPDDRLDLTRADDRLRDARAQVDRAGEVRHLDLDLERDLLVVVDARLDLKRDADVLVGERRDRHHDAFTPTVLTPVLNVVLGIGTRSAMTISAFSPSLTRICG